jgi:cytochrome P450
MTTAPRVDIDLAAFWDDPYPVLARLRADAPAAFVPQMGATLLTRRADVFTCEKLVDVFSSVQPGGLMNRLMGVNMMRKDGPPHVAERASILPAVSPATVRRHWTEVFQAHADRILDRLEPAAGGDLVKDFALVFSAECLKSLTGLTNVTYAEMDAWSQAMIDGIANYAGDPEPEARCHAATAAIDAAIDERIPALAASPDQSLLSVMLAAGLPRESVRANVKLAISGGQNEPRDAIAGCVWALLTHPDQLGLVRGGAVSWLKVFEEYARWISPIGMSPRRIARPFSLGGVDLEPEDRVFLMWNSANRDEACFANADAFEVTRDVSKSVPFGAGPHFCAGAFAARAMIAHVALPSVFGRLKGLRLVEGEPVRVGGWAFRGLLNLPVTWDA